MAGWTTTGRIIRTKRLSGPITSDAIHSLLSELPWITHQDRQMINQARYEVSQEWKVFLKNATVKILLEDQDIVLISGSGTNKLVVQRDGREEIHCDWEETGIGMKLRNGAKKVGSFLFRIFKGAVKAITSSAWKAIGWF